MASKKKKLRKYVQYLWYHHVPEFNYELFTNNRYSYTNMHLEWLYYWNRELNIGANTNWPTGTIVSRGPADRIWTLDSFFDLIQPLYRQARSQARKGMCSRCVLSWPMYRSDRRGVFVWQFCTKYSMFCRVVARNCPGEEIDKEQRKPLPEAPQALCRGSYREDENG